MVEANIFTKRSETFNEFNASMDRYEGKTLRIEAEIFS